MRTSLHGVNIENRHIYPLSAHPSLVNVNWKIVVSIIIKVFIQVQGRVVVLHDNIRHLIVNFFNLLVIKK